MIPSGRRSRHSTFNRFRDYTAEQRLIVLTEEGMLGICEKEKGNGRVPKGVEFLLVRLPADLEAQLAEAREKASKEVRPVKKS